MYTNPFALGWENDQTSGNPEGWSSSALNPGPAYGVLPTGMSSAPYPTVPQIAQFNFLTDASRPSVLNSVVAGTNALQYFSIETKPGSNYTTISRRNGEIYATINWQSQPCPVIEARGTIERQRTTQWARLSKDRRRVEIVSFILPLLSGGRHFFRRRITTIKGREYAWVPQGQAISLRASNSTDEFARIIRNGPSMMLQITVSAFNDGLFEPSVLASVLFLSGKDID